MESRNMNDKTETYGMNLMISEDLKSESKQNCRSNFKNNTI